MGTSAPYWLLSRCTALEKSLMWPSCSPVPIRENSCISQCFCLLFFLSVIRVILNKLHQVKTSYRESPYSNIVLDYKNNYKKIIDTQPELVPTKKRDSMLVQY